MRTDARITFPRILHSEWIKISSLRSTLWSLGLIILFGIGFGLMLASLDVELMGELLPPEAIALTSATAGLALGELIAAVLGVLVISGEYSTGMIRSTLAAVPARLPVLLAKAIVLFALVTVVGAVTVFGTWAVTYPVLDSRGLAVGLDEPGFALALVGTACYLGLVAVFALGLGALLRSAAGGIATALGVLLVLPVLLSILSMAFESITEITPYLLTRAGTAMANLPAEAAAVSTGRTTLLEPWAGALVALAWAVVSLTLGAIVLRRRDA